jgi:predicted DsbA family dithiol-disulfide isomerase
MRIQVWSDVVCPWCFIGKRRLEQAIAELRTDPTWNVTDIEITHRAFQLDPSSTTDGRRTVDVIAEKYGMTKDEAAAMMANVTEVASSVGLAYRLLDTRSGNTLDAHRLVLWAQEHAGLDAAQDLLERILHGYFEEAEPVFTATELLPYVREAGLDAKAAAAMLETDNYRREAADDQQQAGRFGATGVPFFVIDDRFGISGAQPLEVFTETLRKAAEPA